MDVTLVLTHRCNLGCHYCYAGRHLHKDMDENTMERGLDLLFADGAETAQLGFFGGEPFIARSMLKRAVLGARRRAEQAGGRLLVQCTTNGTNLDKDDLDFIVASGMRVTVSLDGVREAHEINRPRTGGRSSFDAALAGLRTLVAHGAEPAVNMVVTPDTVPFVYRSASWLWDEGVRHIDCNLDFSASWDRLHRRELEQEFTTVGWELLARRIRGEQVMFGPFVSGIRSAAATLTNATRISAGEGPVIQLTRPSSASARLQVVVATTGNLYPCAPMVGEDDDHGTEAGLRIGHLDDGLPALAAQLRARRAGCGDGRACACAAYLETGDRDRGGPVGQWFGQLGYGLGRAVGAGFFADRHRVARACLTGNIRPRWKWRAVISGLAAATSGVALVASSMLHGGITGDHDADIAHRLENRTQRREPERPMPAPVDLSGSQYMSLGVMVIPDTEARPSTQHFASSQLTDSLWDETDAMTPPGSGGEIWDPHKTSKDGQ